MDAVKEQSCLTSNRAHVIINQLSCQLRLAAWDIPKTMPFSLDPQPAENEIECANCGALIYYELTRCPNCGVNLYEPENQPAAEHRTHKVPKSRALGKVSAFLRRLAGKPSAAEELFSAFIQRQSELYDDLLLKAGGDPAAVERLVEFERQQSPDANRTTWLQNAIQRWEHDNQKL